MANVGDKFAVGEYAPEPGLFECDSGCLHSWRAPAAGSRFPPLPKGCNGTYWVLEEKRSVLEITPGMAGDNLPEGFLDAAPWP